MHYNRHRYYYPNSGRFVSKDPIGLAGGDNLHNYAPNPNIWIDPLGLAKLPKSGRYHGSKPKYVNPGHHDPSSPNFRGQGSKTSTLPCHHNLLAKYSVPDKDGKHWYSVDDKGVYHRFGNSNDGEMHWNGDSASERGLVIPPDVKKRLDALYNEGKGVKSCG